MEAGITSSAQSNGKPPQKQLYAATLKFDATPFRAERLARAFLAAVPTVMDFGATGYAFTRSEDDPEIFSYVSYWEDKKDHEKWWFSPRMQKVRADIVGIHALPLLPHWHAVIESG